MKECTVYLILEAIDLLQDLKKKKMIPSDLYLEKITLAGWRQEMEQE